MATSYRQPAANSSIGKGGAAPHNTPFSSVTQPICFRQDRKLLDQFRDKMRSLHYALATEKAYRHWILEFLRFHRDGDQWKHPALLGKPQIEAFLTHLAIHRKVSAKTQNQAFSAILFLYKHRHASAGIGRRHSHRSGTARPQGRINDNDLHACFAARCMRRAKPIGYPGSDR